ncbi:hypothetical protein GCM10025867_23790 [Frondihabitans sucicola]|uniref:Uncharacterized protein n=1 Tax=Frondihabitans sucicola TaxID=1268041 RepID=A0ABN6Y337_9MICO|nr:hypothetical protein [Frondihabitans sucicola]BDZ50138.1 hypothetical protein GCM10025867_23790 [Frondihabitans sucicola]
MKPLVVVVGAAGARVRGRAADVETVTAARVDRYLRHLRPVYSVEEVRELTRAALKPRTWYPRAPKALKTPEERAGSSALPTQHELRTWFARVRSEVDAARRVQSFWAAGAAAVLVAAVLGAPALVQGLIG